MMNFHSNDKSANHIRNTSRQNIPVPSPIDSTVSDASCPREDPFSSNSSRKTQFILKKSSSLSQTALTSTNLATQSFEEMIPFPYYPYSYMNFEPKENALPQAYPPYFLPPAIPGMIPPFQHPATTTDTTAVSTAAISTSAPPPPMPMFGAMPRPSFVGGVPMPTEAPQFGPGPPIVTGEKLKGPRGCNLFVFHLPNEITNWDLYLLFRRFGTILSVHIMVNKTTGLSKGYGFVSFAFAEDAAAAIELMDGFRLGKKRLKVQLKRLQDDCLDEDCDGSNWMDRPDAESNCNSASSDNTLSMSPGITRRMHKVFSSSSSDGDGNPDIAIELSHTDTVHSPVKTATTDAHHAANISSHKPIPIAVVMKQNSSIPPRV